MLIPLSNLVEKYNIKINGVVHIGAHECEELSDYLKYISINKIFWFEAIDPLVERMKKNIPDLLIYSAVLSDRDDIVRDFIVTNNVQSSSLHELKKHLSEHPWVTESGRYKVFTSRFDTFIRENEINILDSNFLNLDIQGHELPALIGMGKELDKFDYIYTEINTDEVYADCTLLPNLDKFLTNFERVETKMSGAGSNWGDAFYIKRVFNC